MSVRQSRGFEGTRQKVLEELLSLHLDFIELGRLNEAGPLLHVLMGIAFAANPKSVVRGKRKNRKPA